MSDLAWLDSLVLARGGHDDVAQGVCLMEAVAYFAGEPFNDAPECVSHVIATFGRLTNDWMTDDERQLLKPFVPRLVGTRGTDVTERRSSLLECRLGLLCVDWAVREVVPLTLDVAGRTRAANQLRALSAVSPDATHFARVTGEWTVQLACAAAEAAHNAARDASMNMDATYSAARAASIFAIHDVANAVHAVSGTWPTYGLSNRPEIVTLRLALLDRLIDAARGGR